MFTSQYFLEDIPFKRGKDKEDVAYTHTHTHWNTTQHKKGSTNAIYSNMDGPRDYQAKLRQTEKDKYNLVSLMHGIQEWYKGTYLHNRNRLIGNVLLPKGKMEEG